MTPRIQVVERIEDYAECLEPRNVELLILDVIVVRFDPDIGVESPSRLFRNLHRRQRMSPHPHPGI